MFRLLIIIALTAIYTITFTGDANAMATQGSGYSEHRLDKTDVLVTTNNDLLPAQAIQLEPERWQQASDSPFRINLSSPAHNYSQRWLKLPIRNSSPATSHYRLVVAQPILNETKVYLHDQYDYQSIVENRFDNVEGVSSFSFDVGPGENKDIYIKTRFGLKIPQLSLWQEDRYQTNNQSLANRHWASIGIISILMLLVIAWLPTRLINPWLVLFNLALIALWAALNEQWLDQGTPFWFTKTILSGLVILAALARYQRYSNRLIAIKRLIAATIIAIGLWFIPPAHSLLAFIALPAALMILIFNSLERQNTDYKSNKYSHWERVVFFCAATVGLIITSLGVTNAFGYGGMLNLSQSLQLAIIVNLIMLLLSCVLRLKYDLSTATSDQQFTKNLQQQVARQHATYSQLNADLKIAQDRLKIDELTGLRNSEYFDANLDSEINRTRRHKFPISLLMIKINGLDDITEKHDYEISNRCLQQVAIRCQNHLKRSSDKVCRYYDETFALILPDTHSQGAMHVGQELINRINKSQINIDQKKLSVSVNIGVATGISDPALTAEILFKAAESALEDAIKIKKNPISQIEVNQPTNGDHPN